MSLALGVFLDHVCRLFSDHDRRCVCIAPGNGRHYRGIDHAQSFNSAYPQAGVDYCQRIRVGPHGAGAGRVVLGVGAVADILLDAGIVIPVDRIDQARAVGPEVSGFENACLDLCAAQQQVDVFLLVEKLRVDGRGGARVEAGQGNGAAALGAQTWQL